MQVEGKTTISGEDAAQVIATLNQRVETLAAEARQAYEDEPGRAASMVRDALRLLRMHGVILIRSGEVSEEAVMQSVSGNRVAMAAMDEAWNLDMAPLPGPVVAQIREAMAGGMNRF